VEIKKVGKSAREEIENSAENFGVPKTALFLGNEC